jgi:DNA-binding response OmpR family regulator
MTMFKVSTLFVGGESWLPRFRVLGDLTLDLFHHDGRVEDRWLALDPAEFELLWRLAKDPQRCLSERVLAGWAREQPSVELAIQRLGAKLARHHLGSVLVRHDEGCLCFSPLSGTAPPA